MPGVCGVVHTGAASRGAGTLEAMVGHLRRFDWHVAHHVDVVGASLGHVTVTPAGAAGIGVSGLASAGRLAVAFDGELYAPFRSAPGRSIAQEVASRLWEDGPGYFATVHGCFSCAVWDATAARLSIATDRYAMRPVYWTKAGGRFLFASEIDALLSADGVSSARDEEGLAQFLSFGQYLGETTLYQGIRVVPAGSWLTFDAASGEVTTSAYAPATSVPDGRSDDEWKERIDAAAVAAVRSACTGDDALGLSLSGGLDARTILGLAPEGTRLTCVSLGIPGSIDHRAAAALAGAAGQPHHPLMLAGDFLARFESLLGEMVRLTDGQYLDQGIVLTTLPAYRDLGIQTLLRGHAGELMHMSKAYAFSLDEQALRLRSTAELTDWLWTHLTGYMIGAADETLFTSPFGRRMRDMARAALERQVARWNEVEPAPQRIWRLFVAERLRRETALSLQLFRNYVEVRVPFLEPALVDAVLAAPVHLKVGDELQTFMLRRHRPDFLGVVNANTGAPMAAGPLRTRLGWLRMKVFAKVGVPGYQPYERLGLWLARDVKPLVHRHLLADGAVAVEMFGRDAVARLVAQHEARTHNHTFLLMALLISDAAHRQRDTHATRIVEALG